MPLAHQCMCGIIRRTKGSTNENITAMVAMDNMEYTVVMRAIWAIRLCQLPLGAEEGWDRVMLFRARIHVFGRRRSSTP